jgi:hypothetical protein
MYCPVPIADRTMPLTRCSRSVTATRFVIRARSVVFVERAGDEQLYSDIAARQRLGGLSQDRGIMRQNSG